MRRRVAVVAAALIGLVAFGWLTSTVRATADLTAGRSLTLSDETRDVLRRVRSSVTVTALLRRDDPGRTEAAALLSRYSRRNRNVHVRIVDPDDAPGEMRSLGVDPATDALVAVAGGTVEKGTTVTEQDITSALARVVRGRHPTVCPLVGHGEPDPASTSNGGMAEAVAILKSNGYTVTPVDLLARASIPPACEAVVLAAPAAPLGAATSEIARYLDGGGRALVLADPAATVDLNPLLEPYGLGVEPGLVAEGDEGARLPDDPLTLVVRDYRSASPVARRLSPTLWPGAERITLTPSPAPGLSVEPIARSTGVSFLEREPATSAFRFDAAVDRPGPIVVAAAADRSATVDGRVRRTRVVALGDVDLLTNGIVTQAGNARLLVQAMDWLTLDEDLVSVSTHVPAYRPLSLSPARARYARLLTAGLVPALFLLAGALVWAVRRTR